MVNLDLISASQNSIPIIIRDQNLNEVWSGILEGKESLTLTEGEYLMEATDVSGRTQIQISCHQPQQTVIVGDKQTRNQWVNSKLGSTAEKVVELLKEKALDFATPAVSSQVDLLTTSYSKKALRDNLRKIIDIKKVVKQRLSSRIKRSQKPSIKLAIWSKKPNRGWKLNTSPKQPDLGTSDGALRFLRIARRGHRPLLISLPDHVASLSIPKTVQFDDGVIIEESDTNIVALRAMMERGEQKQAALIATSIAKSKQKHISGMAQVAIALASLFPELDEKDRPTLEWFESLSEEISHLPDTLIAYAWFGVYSSKIDEKQVGKLFVRSVERGIPQQTSALNLLRRGLELLAPGSKGKRVIEALEKVRNWSNHADQDAFFTTFHGTGRLLLAGSKTESVKRSHRQLPGRAVSELGASEDENYLIIEILEL